MVLIPLLLAQTMAKVVTTRIPFFKQDWAYATKFAAPAESQVSF